MPAQRLWINVKWVLSLDLFETKVARSTGQGYLVNLLLDKADHTWVKLGFQSSHDR